MASREPTEQLDPAEAPDADHGFGLACPVCGRRLSRFANYCPHCDAHLPFGGTFTPGKTAVAKALSWILLVVFIGSMAILVGRIVQQTVEAGRG